MARTVFEKQQAFVQRPSNAADFTSGVQKAASSSAISFRNTTDGTFLPGQDIKGAVGAQYFRVTTTP